jgi:hypothetical protein
VQQIVKAKDQEATKDILNHQQG